jgi:PAS domain S-box-containing protein
MSGPDPQRESPDVAAARLAAIVDSSDDAIVSKTLEGVIISWNQAAERLFGYTAAEAVGQHITLIIPEDRLAEEDDVLARLRQGQRISHFETIRRRKNGELVEISLSVSPVRDASGTIVGASKVARDITERRALERLTQTLLEREREKRAEAELLNRSKDQFLATLSHELRTPLNAIYGWARMLERGSLDAEAVARAAQVIVRNTSAQVRLIDDLLDLSRVTAGKMRLDVRPMNVAAVLEAALETVQPAAAAKGIRLESVLDPRTGPIMGDPDRLQQVAWNLLVNAVKFTSKGGRVQVHLRRVNSHIEIAVSDTGEGIDPARIPQIFEPFRQVDVGPTRRHAGLGLGLALVRHLVELHGGRVTATSEGEGHGATFKVTLPVAVIQPAPIPLPAATESGGGAEKSVSLRDIRLLVVDDDPEGLELASLVLVNAGAEVRTAASVADAMATLEGWAPDVLVTDLEMPGEDGFSLLSRARRATTAGGRRLPALALTAYGRSDDRVRVLAAGFNLHLAKPADPAELVLSVASLVGRI